MKKYTFVIVSLLLSNTAIAGPVVIVRPAFIPPVSRSAIVSKPVVITKPSVVAPKTPTISNSVTTKPTISSTSRPSTTTSYAHVESSWITWFLVFIGIHNDTSNSEDQPLYIDP